VYNSRILWRKLCKINGVVFDDFELACLCADYGYEDVLDIVEILPVKLANRAEIEALLTKHEFELAFGE
jgi:hypothetical protein